MPFANLHSSQEPTLLSRSECWLCKFAGIFFVPWPAKRLPCQQFHQIVPASQIRVYTTAWCTLNALPSTNKLAWLPWHLGVSVRSIKPVRLSFACLLWAYNPESPRPLHALSLHLYFALAWDISMAVSASTANVPNMAKGAKLLFGKFWFADGSLNARM